MSPDGSINVAHLWKGFRRDQGRRLLRDQLGRATDRLRGQDTSLRWVLRDLSFTVEPGESVGLIGVNGSGKSTLLKLFSRVMYPHSGRVETRGRIGALIEVTSGIHPDLTGRENVFVYGSLLGWTRREIERRFDEIVDFAEVGDAIDRQVKFYSSGMKMRTGFAVAALLDPDVLLVDEVLAVGDASFQQKCLDRMRVVLQQGTTVVFVSHDLAAVTATCNRSLWLHDGVIRHDSSTPAVVAAYRGMVEEQAEALDVVGPVRVERLEVRSPARGAVTAGEPVDAVLDLHSEVSGPTWVYVGITEGGATPVVAYRYELVLEPGATRVRLSLDHLPVPAGTYYVWFGAYVAEGGELTPWQPVRRVSVEGDVLDVLPRAIVRLAPVHAKATWTVELRATGRP